MSLATMTRDVMTGGSREVLDGIRDPEIALTIWDRDPPCDIGAAFATVDFDEVDDIGIVLTLGEAPHTALREAGYPDAAIGPLAADIAALCHRHAMLTGADRQALRLEVVETDACRRFHADMVTLRMICTYVGPATQWHRVAAPDAIVQLRSGAVGVFKGRMLLDPPTVLHRSPPVSASGERRLVLVVDPA